MVERVSAGTPKLMWPPRWACRGARWPSGGIGGASSARPVWSTAVRGRIGPRAAHRRRWRSGSVGSASRPNAVRSICVAHRGAVIDVWRVLKRNGLNRLAWMDRPTGQVIRRYERSTAGELVHLDIKKVGKIPPGGGWRVHGRGNKKRKRVGYTYLHVAVDDHSRVAFVEAHDNERAVTLEGFWRRAHEWFSANGMAISEVLSDNGPNFRSKRFRPGPRGAGDQTQVHPRLPAPDQRQGRAVQPDHGRRVLVRPTVPIRTRPTPPT